MSTYSPAVSKSPSISRRFRPLSMTCVRPRSRGFPSRVGTFRNVCSISSEACIDLLQLLLRPVLHLAVERVAMGVDANGEWAEVLHPELPQAFGHELLPGDLLDLLDLGRLERGGAADDREIDHPQALHRVDRLVREPTLATDGANAVLRSETLGETHHARARCRPDAELLVLARPDLADVRRRVQEKRAGEVHRRFDTLIEDADLRPVADADDVPLHDHLVPGAELEYLRRVGDRERHFMGGHQTSLSNVVAPSAAMCADARRAAQHW